jgi:hypothetical protein
MKGGRSKMSGSSISTSSGATLLPVAPGNYAYSASSPAFLGGSVLSINTAYSGYAFLVDYISAQIVFNANFVQDPYVTLAFLCLGNPCQHAFPLCRVPTTAAAPEGYQIYLLSQSVNFYVDPQSEISLSGQYMPGPGPVATVFLQLTGRNQKI